MAMRRLLLTLVAPLVMLTACGDDRPAQAGSQAGYDDPGTTVCAGRAADVVAGSFAGRRLRRNTDDSGTLGEQTDVVLCGYAPSAGFRGGKLPVGVRLQVFTDHDGDDDVRRAYAEAGDQELVDLVDAPLATDDRASLADGWWTDGVVRHGSWHPGRPGVGGPGLLTTTVASVRHDNLAAEIAITRSGVPRDEVDDSSAADRELAREALTALEDDLVRG